MKPTHRVGAHETSQQLRIFKPGKSSVVRGSSGVRAKTAIVDPEVAFGIIALGPINIAMHNAGAKFENMPSFCPSHRIGELMGRLYHEVGATISHVGYVSVPPADDGIATQQRVSIGIGNPNSSGHRSPKSGLLVPVNRTRVAIVE